MPPPLRNRRQQPEEARPPLRRSDRIRLRMEALNEAARAELLADSDSDEADAGSRSFISRLLAGDGILPPGSPLVSEASDDAAGAAPGPSRAPLSPIRGQPSSAQPSAARAATERIRRELNDFWKDPPDGCRIEANENNVFQWKAEIDGPPDSPYEGGIFKLKIIFHGEYPYRAPTVTFTTRIFHCNISLGGIICLNILRADWSPVLTVASILISIRSMLTDPNTDDPLMPDHAAVYKENRLAYDSTARLWTSIYAKPESES
ncbi:ubiquitin-conjugating enzyme E2-16 kDa-like [Drosophila serrata]|uniref:ubiquitin-conjugating enzyme E2-16 kDa-like n=1 Tax=Drosophila serrata TaxID=7274 RepID=UPI000A1D3925|nr:ubiquitin-conjugating enzyme E2-16 kDa-like [Drosophila serrata]